MVMEPSEIFVNNFKVSIDTNLFVQTEPAIFDLDYTLDVFYAVRKGQKWILAETRMDRSTGYRVSINQDH